jgi:hypothetical protein
MYRIHGTRKAISQQSTGGIAGGFAGGFYIKYI